MHLTTHGFRDKEALYLLRYLPSHCPGFRCAWAWKGDREIEVSMYSVSSTRLRVCSLVTLLVMLFREAEEPLGGGACWRKGDTRGSSTAQLPVHLCQPSTPTAVSSLHIPKSRTTATYPLYIAS